MIVVLGSGIWVRTRNAGGGLFRHGKGTVLGK